MVQLQMTSCLNIIIIFIIIIIIDMIWIYDSIAATSAGRMLWPGSSRHRADPSARWNVGRRHLAR